MIAILETLGLVAWSEAISVVGWQIVGSEAVPAGPARWIDGSAVLNEVVEMASSKSISVVGPIACSSHAAADIQIIEAVQYDWIPAID